MNEDQPTFEDLIGTANVQEWTNNVTDGELSVVSNLANKQLKLAAEILKLEMGLSKANQEKAYDWLISNGHEGLIKNEVLLKFGREESEVVDETVSALQSRGLSPQVRQSVHPSTLKAFIKEQLTSGNDVPTEPFGIYIGSKATIKKD